MPRCTLNTYWKNELRANHRFLAAGEDIQLINELLASTNKADLSTLLQAMLKNGKLGISSPFMRTAIYDSIRNTSLKVHYILGLRKGRRRGFFSNFSSCHQSEGSSDWRAVSAVKTAELRGWQLRWERGQKQRTGASENGGSVTTARCNFCTVVVVTVSAKSWH